MDQLDSRCNGVNPLRLQPKQFASRVAEKGSDSFSGAEHSVLHGVGELPRYAVIDGQRLLQTCIDSVTVELQALLKGL